MIEEFDERALRAEFRSRWAGPPLFWVEAADGGTDGGADVLLPFLPSRMYIPVELKKWLVSTRNGSIEFTCRPSQFRFHRLAANAGMRTAFVAILEHSLKMVALPGAFMPAPGSHAQPKVREFGDVNELVGIFEDASFWRGK